jgi:hydroxyacid-oxoacid transhydrogenase
VVDAPAAFRFTGPANPERHLRAAGALGADTRNVPASEGGNMLAERLVAVACGVRRVSVNRRE